MSWIDLSLWYEICWIVTQQQNQALAGRCEMKNSQMNYTVDGLSFSIPRIALGNGPRSAHRLRETIPHRLKHLYLQYPTKIRKRIFCLHEDLKKNEQLISVAFRRWCCVERLNQGHLGDAQSSRGNLFWSSNVRQTIAEKARIWHGNKSRLEIRPMSLKAQNSQSHEPREDNHALTPLCTPKKIESFSRTTPNNIFRTRRSLREQCNLP